MTMEIAQILSTASVICYVVAAISGILAVVFWFRFNIRKVIGELSGRTAKKSIEKMRQANEMAGKKREATTSSHNAKREMLAEPREEELAAPEELEETDLLVPAAASSASDATTALLNDDGATTLLDQSIQTTAPQRPAGKKLTILDEVMLIHTDEVID